MSKRFRDLSSYMNFQKVIAGRKYSMSVVGTNFDRLVEKGDYPKEDRDMHVERLTKYSKEASLFEITA